MNPKPFCCQLLSPRTSIAVSRPVNTMEMIARLQQASLQDLLQVEVIPSPTQMTTVPDDDNTAWMDVPEWARRWTRLATIARIVSCHAATGSVIQYLELMRERRAQLAAEAYRRAAGTSVKASAKPKTTSTPSRTSPDVSRPMAKGNALSRSKVPDYPKEPEDCAHENMSHPRGGHGHAWITCLSCGSRWERTWDSGSDVVPSI